MHVAQLLRPVNYSAYFARLVPPWVGVITLLCMLLQIAGDSTPLLYDRQALSSGEVWRLVSAHLLHLTPLHLGENIAALLLINLLVGSHLTSRRWLLASLICALFVSLALYLLAPQVEWYVGLSGVLHGLLVIGVITAAMKKSGSAVYVVALAAIATKLILEGLYGPLPGAEQLPHITIVIEAHRYGAISGLGYALFVEWPLHRYTHKKRDVPPV